MAGQPPEPTYQPSGQDQGLTQGRPAWQQPSYPPPAGAPGGQQGYSGQSYNPQEQAYPAQEQAYPGQDYQNYQGGYQPPAYGGQPGQPGAGAAAPQWQGVAGAAPGSGRAKAKQKSGEKGFVGSLFDFSFSSFVTPKIIKVLYVLVTIWTALIGLAILIYGFKLGGMTGGLFTLIIIEPIFLLLTLGIYRVVLEAFMVIFRIYEETKKIRESNESQG